MNARGYNVRNIVIIPIKSMTNVCMDNNAPKFLLRLFLKIVIDFFGQDAISF